MVRLANGLQRTGVSVDLVVMDGSKAGFRHLLDQGVRIVDLQSPRMWQSLPAIMSYLRRERSEAIIAAAPLANGLAGLAGWLGGRRLPVILTEHGVRLFGFASDGSLRKRLLERILRFGYRRATALVGVSAGVAAELTRQFDDLADRICVIYNPVWSTEFEAASLMDPEHPWLSGESDIPVVIAAGRFSDEKGFDTLLEAMALACEKRDVRLILLGEGGNRPALERQVRRLELVDAVDMPGFTPDPQRFMRAASLLVLSSRREALPTVIIEALACGTPVVSTNCPTGPGEILEGGKYGTLVPVDDPGALAEGILAALSASPDREALKARARSFSIEAAAGKYLELLDGIKNGHPPNQQRAGGV